MGSSTNFHTTQPVFTSLDASIASEKQKYETMNSISGIRRARNHVSAVMQSQEMPASTTTIFD